MRFSTTCASCGAPFRAQMSTARTCGDRCRQRLHRERVAARAVQAAALLTRQSRAVGDYLMCEGDAAERARLVAVLRDVAREAATVFPGAPTAPVEVAA